MSPEIPACFLRTGRECILVAKLKELKKDDNTLIISLSDNGAQGNFSSYSQLRQGIVRNTGPVGTAGSFDYQEQNWAYLSNNPLRHYKNNFHEGGLTAVSTNISYLR